MNLKSKKILVGIFSYNEGENLRSIYGQIKTQCKDIDYKIVLLDESDENKSTDIVSEILKDQKVEKLTKGPRKGKSSGYNLLFKYFLDNDFNILLHFDADHVLSGEVVRNLAETIDKGFDVSTCLNKPFKPLNMFQRVLYVLTMPATLEREDGTFVLPLVGHNGAYSRKAVSYIGKIPKGGIDEEMFILSKVLFYNLSYTIVRNSISYFTLPGTLEDYIQSTRRVYGKVKAFNEWHPIMDKNGEESSDPNHVVKKIYSFSPFKIIIQSLLSDLFASIFAPYIFIIRWTLLRTTRIYESDTWEAIETTKILKGGLI